MDQEELSDTGRTFLGVVAACAMVFSFGWLFHELKDLKHLTATFEIVVLAVAAFASAVFVWMFSFHLAMTIAAVVVLVDTAALLLAFVGFGPLFRFFHPYGVYLGVVAFFFTLVTGLSRK
jgi:hypothetical protein